MTSGKLRTPWRGLNSLFGFLGRSSLASIWKPCPVEGLDGHFELGVRELHLRAVAKNELHQDEPFAYADVLRAHPYQKSVLSCDMEGTLEVRTRGRWVAGGLS
jgi:hypothetical protein